MRHPGRVCTGSSPGYMLRSVLVRLLVLSKKLKVQFCVTGSAKPSHFITFFIVFVVSVWLALLSAFVTPVRPR